jgi:biopolymer transport protein TolR
MAFTTHEGKTQTTLAEINMVPFIDVVLVLLIIFMVTAPVIQSGIEVNVPETQTVRELAEEKLVITIDKEQLVFLQSEAVNVNELGARVRAKLPDPDRQSVYLQADKDVPYQTLATVMDKLKLANINNVVLVTQPLRDRK